MQLNFLKNVLLLLGAIIFSYSISLITTTPFFPLVILLVFCSFQIVDILKQLSTIKTVTFFILLLGIHLLLLIYQINYQNLPLGGTDWMVYDASAEQSISLMNSNVFLILSSTENFFVKLVAIFYVLTNHSVSFIYFFVFFCSLVLLNFLLKIQRILTNGDNKFQFVPLIFFIWPIEVIMSITFLREIPIQMCLVIGLYNLLIFEKNRKITSLISCLLFTVLSAMMHAGTIGVFFIFFVYLVLNNREKKIKITPLRIIIAMLLIGLLLNSPLWTAMTQKFSSLNLELGSNESLELGRQAGRTTYITKTSFSNIFEMIIYTPYRFLMYELSPLPWQIISLSTAIAFLIDSVPRYFIIATIFTKFKRNKRRLSKIAYMLLIVIIVTDLIFCWGTNNYGTAIRHRAKILPFEILIAFLPLERHQNDKEVELLSHKE